jgi:hypothetical protein
MRRLISLVVSGLFILAVVSPVTGGPVRVRGHVRKDGTYVSPHFRSAPDRSFSNNWSTKGNFNPYTGRDGTAVSPPLKGSSGRLPVAPAPAAPAAAKAAVPTVIRPPASAGDTTFSAVPTAPRFRHPSASKFEPTPRVEFQTPSVPRLQSAERLRTLPTNSESEPMARQQLDSRVSAAARLRELGVIVDPARESLLSMSDKESRVHAALRLRDLGHKVDWRSTSLLDMVDMEGRINSANRLRDLGHNVDWRSTSFLDMVDMEGRINSANRLKASGVSVDWRKYSRLQLVDIELRGRSSR